MSTLRPVTKLARNEKGERIAVEYYEMASDKEEVRTALERYRGRHLLEFENMEINERDILLGESWLGRRQYGVIVAPSGQGKSVSTIQMALEWACGRIAFGITPMEYNVANNNGMRILIVQAEDDDGDMKAMTKMAEKLKFTPTQRKLIAENTLVYHIDDVSGPEFFPVLEDLAESFKPDLVIINPFNRYLGDDAKKQDKLVQWLDFLSKAMNKLNFGTLMVHHTNKTTNPDNQNEKADVDWQYCYAGDPMLINRARASIMIWPTSVRGVYKFIGAKRGKKLPWHPEGNNTVRYFKHSDDENYLIWLDADLTEQAAASVKKKKSGNNVTTVDPQKLLGLIPAAGAIAKKLLLATAQGTLNAGKHKIEDALAILEHAGDISTVQLPKPINADGKVKKGAHPEGWTRSAKLEQIIGEDASVEGESLV